MIALPQNSFKNDIKVIGAKRLHTPRQILEDSHPLDDDMETPKSFNTILSPLCFLDNALVIANTFSQHDLNALAQDTKNASS